MASPPFIETSSFAALPCILRHAMGADNRCSTRPGAGSPRISPQLSLVRTRSRKPRSSITCSITDSNFAVTVPRSSVIFSWISDARSDVAFVRLS